MHKERIRYVKGEPKLIRLMNVAKKASDEKRKREKEAAKNAQTEQVLEDEGVHNVFNGESVTKLAFAMSWFVSM